MLEDAAVVKAAEDLIALKGHPGWKILMHRLTIEAEIAMDELVKIDAADTDAVNSAQSLVKRLTWFGDTIEELIEEGLQVEDHYAELISAMPETGGMEEEADYGPGSHHTEH